MLHNWKKLRKTVESLYTETNDHHSKRVKQFKAVAKQHINFITNIAPANYFIF